MTHEKERSAFSRSINDLGLLLDESLLTDTVLRVSGREIPVHRAILAARWPRFYENFLAGSNEPSCTSWRSWTRSLRETFEMRLFESNSSFASSRRSLYRFGTNVGTNLVFGKHSNEQPSRKFHRIINKHFGGWSGWAACFQPKPDPPNRSCRSTVYSISFFCVHHCNIENWIRAIPFFTERNI